MAVARARVHDEGCSDAFVLRLRWTVVDCLITGLDFLHGRRWWNPYLRGPRGVARGTEKHRW